MLVQSFDAKGVLFTQVARTYAGGLLVREVYLDASGRPEPQGDGYSGISMSYRNGLETERVFLDVGGRPVRTAQKYAKQRADYDERGNPVEVAYLDEDDRLTLNALGYAKVKRQFNEFGDADEEVFLGADGAPTNIGAGYARIRRQHDRQGRAIEIRHFDAAGRPVWPKDDCSFRRSYDGFGRETATFCIDQDGRPAPHPTGWTRKEITYDAVGNALREQYRYEAGAPASQAPRLGRIERIHDPWGNTIRQTSFDERGNPIKGINDCHQVARHYSRANDIIDEACFDANGDPAEGKDGMHRVAVLHDERGRTLHMTIYYLRDRPGWPTRIVRGHMNEQGRLHRVEALDDTGVVRMAREFDERQRIIKVEYFDGQGRPELGPDGYAKSRVLAFDDFGGADTEFEDERGKPVELGIRVRGVKDGGPGARAGVRVNDLIVRYDGRDIHFGIFAAAQRAPGQAMRELVVLRDNAGVTMQVEPVPLALDIVPVPRRRRDGNALPRGTEVDRGASGTSDSANVQNERQGP